MKTVVFWLVSVALACGSGLGIGGCFTARDDAAYLEYLKREQRFEKWYKAEYIKTKEAEKAKSEAERKAHEAQKKEKDAIASVEIEKNRYQRYYSELDAEAKQLKAATIEAKKRQELAEVSLRDERGETTRLRKEVDAAREDARRVREGATELLQQVIRAGDEARKLLEK